MDIASLAYSVDSSQLAKANQELDKNADAANRASAAADDLERSHKSLQQSSSSVSKEQQRMAERVEVMRQAEERQTRATREANKAKEVQALNIQRVIGQIDPAIAKLNQLAEAEKRLERATELGVLKPQVLEQYRQKIEATRASVLQGGIAFDKYGLSAKQTAAALRGVPAQLTDIAVSLQGGQRPLTVLLQQGGQLKDMFGGVVPAAKALGGAILGLVNPFTLTAAALGGFLYLLNSAEKQSQRVNMALLTTGNYAGVTAGQIDSLVDSLSGIDSVTRGGAREALISVAQSGRIAGDQFEMVAEIAARMESSVGQSLDTTIKKFEDIGKDPVAALLRLNETEHFLTQTHLDRIDALIREGDQQGAAAEAALIYRNRLDEIATAAEAARPHLSQIGVEIRSISSAALEGATNFAEFLAATSRVTDSRPAWQRFGPLGAINFLRDMRNAQPAQQTTIPMVPGAVDSRRAAERKAESDAAEKEIQRQIESYYGLDSAVNKLERSFAQLTDAQRRQYEADGTYARLMDRAIKQDQDRAKSGARRAQATNAEDNAAARLVETIQRQITANEQLAETGEKVSASDRLVIQARQLLDDKTNTMTASTRRLLESMLPVLKATDEQAEATQRLNRDRAANAALTERLAQVEKLRQEQAEVDLLGMGRGSEVTDALRRQLEIQREYLKEVDTLKRAQRNKNTALSAEEYAVELRLLEDSRDRRLEIERQFNEQRMATMGDWRNGAIKAAEDYLASGRNVAAQYEQAFNNAFTGMEDALVKFVTTGKFSFTDLANSIIADLARIAARQAITGLVGNILSAFMPGASTAAGVSSSQLMKGSSFTMQGQSWGGSFGGGREYGGSVNSGSLYQVGERGKPELFTAGSKQYLIPGDNGRVEPIKSSHTQTGSQQMPTRIAINLVHKGQPIDVESQSAEQQPDGSLLINMVTNTIKQDMARGGFDQTFRSIGIAQNRGARG